MYSTSLVPRPVTHHDRRGVGGTGRRKGRGLGVSFYFMSSGTVNLYTANLPGAKTTRTPYPLQGQLFYTQWRGAFILCTIHTASWTWEWSGNEANGVIMAATESVSPWCTVSTQCNNGDCMSLATHTRRREAGHTIRKWIGHKCMSIRGLLNTQYDM